VQGMLRWSARTTDVSESSVFRCTKRLFSDAVHAPLLYVQDAWGRIKDGS